MPKDPKIVKTAVAVVIVAAAFFIMIPGFMALLGSLLRLLLIVVIAGGACLALAHARRKAMRLVSGKAKESAQIDSKANSAEAGHASP